MQEAEIVRYIKQDNEVIIPKSEQDGSWYLKRIIFAEMLVDPEKRITIPEASEVLDVPANILRRWKQNVTFQHLVAKRAREMALGGIGMGLAYAEAMRIISDPDTPLRIRADMVKHLQKMDMKRIELAVSVYKHRKGDTNADKTIEALITEVEVEEVLADE